MLTDFRIILLSSDSAVIVYCNELIIKDPITP